METNVSFDKHIFRYLNLTGSPKFESIKYVVSVFLTSLESLCFFTIEKPNSRWLLIGIQLLEKTCNKTSLTLIWLNNHSKIANSA